jgi:subtilisin family serine protease
MKFLYNNLRSKRFKFFNIYLIAAFAMLLAIQAEAFSQYKEVVRGERPPIDINNVPEEAYEKGVIRIKFEEAAYKNIAEIEPGRTEKGALTFGLASVDALNAQFQVFDASKTFSSPALSNKFQDRHQLWGFHLWFDLHVDESADIISMVKAYMLLPEVAFAEPHYTKELIGNVLNEGEAPLTYNESIDATNRDGGMLFPDDPQFDQQWHYHNTGQTGGLVGADISLPEAWTQETGNVQVIIAVVDGGIGITHPDLAGNIWEGIGYNFVSDTPTIIPHDHGSHVGGTIAAVTNNDLGVSGIAGGWGDGPGVALMSSQVFEPGWGQSGGFAIAPVYSADNGAAISQNSWGYTSTGYYEQAVLDAIDYFNINGGGEVMEGGLTIFAAGNGGNSGANYPGFYSGAKAIAGTNHNDQLSWYSNYGGHIEVSAPGGETNSVTQEGVLSTLNSGYGFYQGTSMACPHVSGTLALLLSHAPGEFTNEEIWDMLVSTTDNHYANNPGYIGLLGSGRINAQAAMLELVYHMADPEAPAAPTNFSVTADENGDLAAELNWTNPIENASGEPLTDLDTIHIYRNNALIHSILNPVIGDADSYTDNDVPQAGNFNYVVRGANFAGTGLAIAGSAYIGHDLPAAPGNILLSPEGDNGMLVWDAPTQGLNDGFFDGTNLTYSIVRFPDETEVAEGITATSFLDDDLPNIGNFYYEITAHNHIGQGGMAESNVATLGAEGLLIYEPFDLPVNNLPTGWSIEGQGTSNWGTYNAATAGGEAPQMRFNWSPSFTAVSRLITHEVNVGGISEVGLSFRNYVRNYSTPSGDLAVQYTVDGGDTWTDLWTNSGSADYGPLVEEFVIELPANAQFIQFAFHWDGNTWNLWDWNIDDVILEALGTAEHYSVMFEVKDADGNIIPDAIVSMNGYENDPGEYIFTDMEPGTHEFSVHATCYLTLEDQVTITNEDKVIEIFLENHTGDANADGVVNVLDVIVIAQYFQEQDPYPFCFNNADVNDDDLIDVLDIIGTMNIFLDGKISPHPIMQSDEAHIFLHPEGIRLISDGTLAGLQFELTGNLPEKGSLKLMLDGFELVYVQEQDLLKGMVFSLENNAIPEGLIEVIAFEQNSEMPDWGYVLAGNLNAIAVPVVGHKDTTTGILEPDASLALKAFPNPASDELWVEFINEQDKPVQVTLVNLNGDQVLSDTVTEKGLNTLRLDLNNLASGLYFLNIETDNELFTKKIMIR